MLAANKKLIKKVIKDLNGLSFKNSKGYNKKDIEFFAERYYKILNLLPDIKQDSTCLEIGLAGGEMAFILKKFLELKILYTLEHPNAYRLYKTSFGKKLKESNIVLTPVDLRNGKLPWKDNYFDFVMLSEVLEHLIPSDAPAVLKEIKRVLKKGGYLVITTPNVASLLKRINLVRGKNPVEFDLRLHEKGTFGHIREYTMHELESMTNEQGFVADKKDFYMIDTNRNVFTHIEDISSKFYPPFANNLFLVVRK